MVFYLVRLPSGYVALATQSLTIALDVARGFPSSTLAQAIR
jgi:hypothetical protein